MPPQRVPQNRVPAGPSPQNRAAQGKKKKKKPASKKSRRIGIIFTVFAFLAAACTVLYTLFAFSSLPFFTYWRTIWIETAMTTGHHHWLAENLVPYDSVTEVMSNATTKQDVIGGKNGLQPNGDGGDNLPSAFKKVDDILGQKNLQVGDLDYAGNKVLINDLEEGLIVSEIVGSNFRGKIMLIDDPSRVYLGMTPTPGVSGLRIRAMMQEYDAIAGINASGFLDPYENGNGSDVVGLSCASGEYWGKFISDYGSIVLTDDNRLVVGNISVWENYNIRDGVQFGPVLIADGVARVSGSAGYGIQPRTAIGQRADGVIAFLVIDGRNISWSLGCTVGDLVDILMAYKIENAACCDGGASSCIAYKDEVITKNCSLNPAYGRPLPNAFLVRKKADSTHS